MNLHHYCSNNSFLEILRSRVLWATELSLSNDRLEGRWIRTTFQKVCQDKGVSTSDLTHLVDHVDRLIDFFGAGGFCLSEEGDLLSQWRGYAEDGAGVSIGFSKDYLEQLSESEVREFGVALRKVTYDPPAQEKQIAEFVDKSIVEIANGALRTGQRTILSLVTEEEETKRISAFNRLSMVVFTMFPLLYTLKNPAFGEEKEWRLITQIPKGGDSYMEADLPHLDFIARNNRIVPIRRISLLGSKQPITNVVLGPRNITPIHVVSAALKKYGFGDVKILTSSASYR